MRRRARRRLIRQIGRLISKGMMREYGQHAAAKTPLAFQSCKWGSHREEPRDLSDVRNVLLKRIYPL